MIVINWIWNVKQGNWISYLLDSFYLSKMKHWQLSLSLFSIVLNMKIVVLIDKSIMIF
jgi:hypothetical protein